MRKRLIGILMAACMLLSMLPHTAWAAETAGGTAGGSSQVYSASKQGKFSLDDEKITRAEFANALANLSGNALTKQTTSSVFKDVPANAWYCSAAKWANDHGILSSEAGKFNPNGLITREQTTVMLYNYAKYTGIDVSPIEGNAINEFEDVNNISAWAKNAVRWGLNAGIITRSSERFFKPKTQVTHAEASEMMLRMEAALKPSLKDDFYTAINKEWLKQAKIPAGETSISTMDEMVLSNDHKLQVILEGLRQGKYAAGTKEQKLSDFYKSVLDIKSRNQQGIAPIKKYLAAYNNAKNLKELIEADSLVYKETGTAELLGFGMSTNPTNSIAYSMYHEGLTPSLSKDMYSSKAIMGAYRQYLSKILTSAGEQQGEVQKHTDKFISLERALAKAELNPEDAYDLDKTYNIYSIDELSALYPQLDIPAVVKGMGYQVPRKVIISDKLLAEQSASYFNEKDLETLKLYARVRFLMDFGSTLNESFRNAGEVFGETAYGTEGRKSNKEYAVIKVQAAMPDYLGELYTERYFSEAAKKDVEKLIHEFISIYKTSILKADWMSNATKQEAIQKLDCMTIKVGYPEAWPHVLDTAVIRSYEDGGSYFKNLCEVNKAERAANRAMQGKEVENTEWEMAAYEVNAYYNPSFNEIVFPAGILQAPIYSVDAPIAQNLGGIGCIIAHEISHAFDSSGSQFDEKGSMKNWWTEGDYQKFDEKCQRIVEFYDGIQIIPGIFSNGNLTLTENIADLGGVGCSLKLLAQRGNPDYKTFFEAYAKLYKSVITSEEIEYTTKEDTHSIGKIRVNQTLMNFEEFYKVFDITKTDKMYIAPEKRVGIW